jgi:hypothetical protein
MFIYQRVSSRFFSRRRYASRSQVLGVIAVLGSLRVVEAPKLEHCSDPTPKVWISLNLKNHKIGQNSTKLNKTQQNSTKLLRPLETIRLSKILKHSLRYPVTWPATKPCAALAALAAGLPAWRCWTLGRCIEGHWHWYFMDFIWFYYFLKNECQSQITPSFTIKPSAGQKILPLWQQRDFQWVCHRSAWSESNMRQSEHLQQASLG